MNDSPAAIIRFFANYCSQEPEYLDALSDVEDPGSTGAFLPVESLCVFPSFHVVLPPEIVNMLSDCTMLSSIL
jgi:hypothetical protein